MKNALCLMCLSVLLVGCNHKSKEATEPLVNVQTKGVEITPLNPRTGEPLKVTPCIPLAEAEGEESLPKCAIFDTEFKTLRIAQINVIFSERKTGSVTCVITIQKDGGAVEYPVHFPDLNECPKDWFF